MIDTDDRAIIKLYSGTLLQLFHVTWHSIIGQKGGVCRTYMHVTWGGGGIEHFKGEVSPPPNETT